MLSLAVAGSVLFLTQYALHDDGSSVIGDNILYDTFLGIFETEANGIIHDVFLWLDNF